MRARNGVNLTLKMFRKVTDFREFAIILVIGLVVIAMSCGSPVFFSPENMLQNLLSLSIESIIAIGMTVLLVSGGFDLSVGAAAGLCGAVSAICMVKGAPVPIAIAVGLGLGTLTGTLNGLIITRIGINPFIATLGMMSVLRGILEVLTAGGNISPLPQAFCNLGQKKYHGVQLPIIISMAMVVLGDLLLRKSRFFRQNYYIGGNERAALLSGIPVKRIMVFNYALMGFLAALAGLLMTARFGSASATAGSGLELKVISAVIIGGASLKGGEGTVFGAFLGSLLMALIVNSLFLLGVDPSWNRLVIGATLLIAVTIDTLAKRYKAA